jgi:hypothetical protein
MVGFFNPSLKSQISNSSTVTHRAARFSSPPADPGLGPLTTDPATLNISSRELFRNGVLRENLEEKKAEERATFTAQLILVYKLNELGSNLCVQDNDGNNGLHLLLSKTPSDNSNFD